MGPLQHLTLTPEVMKTWGAAMWAFFLLLVALILAILYDDLSKLQAIGYLKWYVLWAAIFLGGMVRETRKQEALGKMIHIHHYFIGITLTTFICYQDPFLSIVHGFFFGMFLEGGCRWGYDPMYEAPDNAVEGTLD